MPKRLGEILGKMHPVAALLLAVAIFGHHIEANVVISDSQEFVDLTRQLTSSLNISLLGTINASEAVLDKTPLTPPGYLSNGTLGLFGPATLDLGDYIATSVRFTVFDGPGH